MKPMLPGPRMSDRDPTDGPSLRVRVVLTVLELGLGFFHVLGSLADCIRERGLGVRWPKPLPKGHHDG